MKIMQIVSGTGVNGAVMHCLLLSRELARRGHEVNLVCRPGAWIGEQVKSERIEVIHSDLQRWPADELRRIAAILDNGDYDVVNTHMSRASLFGVLLRLFTRVPRVATAHCRHFQPHWALNDMVIAVSEACRRYHRLVNLVPARRIVTVHNAIDERRFEGHGPHVRHEVRKKLGIADSEPLIAIVANVIPRKGHLYVVRALPAIIGKVSNVKLILVGDQNHRYSQLVRSEADALQVSSHVHWLGRRDDVSELLAASDLLVLASVEEALGLAILEAMATGLPSVGTNIGGIGECIVPNQTGLLVPPRNPAALAEAITELLVDDAKRRQMGEAARCRFLEEFSTASQVRAIEAVFEQVARRRRLARAA